MKPKFAKSFLLSCTRFQFCRTNCLLAIPIMRTTERVMKLGPSTPAPPSLFPARRRPVIRQSKAAWMSLGRALCAADHTNVNAHANATLVPPVCRLASIVCGALSGLSAGVWGVYRTAIERQRVAQRSKREQQSLSHGRGNKINERCTRIEHKNLWIHGIAGACWPHGLHNNATVFRRRSCCLFEDPTLVRELYRSHL